MSNAIFQRKSGGEESWISVSDIMAGLMMVFLFIAVVYARNVQEIVATWQDTESAIRSALYDEFKNDLPKWDAEIDNATLTVRFKAPEILFKQGEDDLTPKFEEILADFMPRYIDLLATRFDADIDEARIEGHTSSEFSLGDTQTEAFIKNMGLSQARTRAVLEYSLALPGLQNHTPWMIKKVSANGLSSAKLVFSDGVENKRRSRRVEFTIKTNTREVLQRVAPAVAEQP